jgi:hypothetical protein
MPTRRMPSHVVAGIVRAEERLIRIDRLVERLQTGWPPVASEIDPDIPQRTLQQAHFAYDAVAYPDGMGFLQPADEAPVPRRARVRGANWHHPLDRC